jgi:hypothetical protein
VADLPSKVSLDANADQALASARDLRAEMAGIGPGGDQLLVLGETMAGLLREQFPAAPDLGRVALAVSLALSSVETAAQVHGYVLSRLELNAVASLAAEQLEREAKSP